MARQVDATYGDALFELAAEEKTTDAVLEEVTALLQVLEEHEELLQVLVHPEVSREEKLRLIQAIFEGRVSGDVMGMLLTVVRNDRGGELPAICRYVVGRIKEYQGVGMARVTSAVELSPEQKKRIERRLEETTSYTRVETDYRVDSAMIGGLTIRIGDRVVDSSVRGQLERMAQTLTQGERQIIQKEGAETS